jgi:hypothetical protein
MLIIIRIYVVTCCAVCAPLHTEVMVERTRIDNGFLEIGFCVFNVRHPNPSRRWRTHIVEPKIHLVTPEIAVITHPQVSIRHAAGVYTQPTPHTRLNMKSARTIRDGGKTLDTRTVMMPLVATEISFEPTIV